MGRDFRAGEFDVDAPARGLRAVTPSDGADLPDGPCRSLYVGAAGNVSVIAADDTSPVTFVGVPAGVTLPVRAKRVRATGTTAGSLIAYY